MNNAWRSSFFSSSFWRGGAQQFFAKRFHVSPFFLSTFPRQSFCEIGLKSVKTFPRGCFSRRGNVLTVETFRSASTWKRFPAASTWKRFLGAESSPETFPRRSSLRGSMWFRRNPQNVSTSKRFHGKTFHRQRGNVCEKSDTWKRLTWKRVATWKRLRPAVLTWKRAKRFHVEVNSRKPRRAGVMSGWWRLFSFFSWNARRGNVSGFQVLKAKETKKGNKRKQRIKEQKRRKENMKIGNEKRQRE